MNILFVEELTVIDFSYLDHIRGLLGETYILDIELHGDLDNEKVIFDFSYAKKQIKSFIDREYDHKLWVPIKSKYIDLNDRKDHLELMFQLKNKTFIKNSGPKESFCLIDDDKIDIKNVEVTLEHELKAILPDNVHKVNVDLRIEEINGAYFHYSHGLKQHYGNCQRIAHGHRSKVIVFVNGKRDSDSEKMVAKELNDIYIGIKENVVEETTIKKKKYKRFFYLAEQGEFDLTVADDSVLLIENETTIECISEHFAKKLFKKFDKKNSISVRIYEGVNKGAIYTINC